MRKFSETAERVRKMLGFSQAYAAQLLELNPKTIAAREEGEIDRQTFLEMMKAYGVMVREEFTLEIPGWEGEQRIRI